MKILVLNCGSSSLKYQLINMDDESVLAKGNYERIGEQESFLTHKIGKEKYIIKQPVMNHTEAIKIVLEQFLNNEYKVINSLDEIDAIGHRIVHGGEIFDKSVLITDEVIEKIDECSSLAPLHNPAHIQGIKACKEAMPNKKMVAVFDTAFHQTMPEDAYIYPIPYKFYEDYKLRRYGAHGTSHQFVSKIAAKFMNRPIEELKIVTCHLGQGASICAIKGGKSIDTSMGLTPLGGIPMVTRSGDLDPSLVLDIMEKEDLSPKEMNNLLNKKSGLYGITGLDPDFREIEKASTADNEKAKLAIQIFNKTIAQFIAKYAVSMKGLDVIVFTGGIGENQINIRKGICDYLEFLGVNIDIEKNNISGEEIEISREDSKIKVYIIPTNEELVIARDTKALVQ